MGSQQNPEPLSPSGYLRGLRIVFDEFPSTNLDLDEDEPYDAELDSPFTVFQHVRLRSVEFDA